LGTPIKVYDNLSFFVAYVDMILQYPPFHINASISLEECFCLTFRYYLLLLNVRCLWHVLVPILFTS